MLVEMNEKVHVVVRRTFETDLRRHLIGVVRVADGSIARIEGYFMVFDKVKNIFYKNSSLRTTIIDLSSSGYWVNIIPKTIELDKLKYTYDNKNKLILTDGEQIELDINEFGALR